MEKKGLSPLIATVLLIAIVVVIALIIFMWFSGLKEETITKFGKKNIKLVCRDVKFEASYSAGILALSNTGNVPLYSMKMKIVGTGSHQTKDIRDDLTELEWPNFGLNPGDVFSANIESVQGVSNAEEILLIPVLVGKSKKGEKRYTCDETAGHKIVI